MLKPAASEAGEPSRSNLRKKNGPSPSQSHRSPPAVKICVGCPVHPCAAKPQTKYTIAATDRVHNDAIMVCAALRERPNPALMSASPPAVRGTSKIQTRQITDAPSDSAGTGRFVTPFHPPKPHESAPPEPAR